MSGAGRWMLVATLTVALASCGGARESGRSGWFGWFGKRAEAPSLAPPGGYPEEVDSRGLVRRITEVRLDRAPGGAVVTALALPPTVGWHSAELVPETTSQTGRPVPEGGTLTLQFRVAPPLSPQPAGSARAREISASTFLTDQDLAGVRVVAVRGVENRQSARR